VKDILLDELEWTGSMTELIVELIGQPGLLQHPLSLGQTRIHVTYIFEDVLSDQLVPARSLLDLRLQQIACLRSFQLFPLLVECRWRLQRYVGQKEKLSSLVCVFFALFGADWL
jgi:hypothetical protein